MVVIGSSTTTVAGSTSCATSSYTPDYLFSSHKNMVSAENSYSPTDLFHYAEMLLKESKVREASMQHCTNNYGWLKSRPIQNEVTKTDKDLERLRPMIQKISSENCAKIAVKLDAVADEEESSAAILTKFKKLLEDQYSIQLMEKNVVKAKERCLKKNRVNKVHPVLLPAGRQPTEACVPTTTRFLRQLICDILGDGITEKGTKINNNN